MTVAETPSLRGARAKLDRADEHRHELDRELRLFGAREPYRFTVPSWDAETGHFVMYGHCVEDPPLKLGAVLGDYINNVRSALDHIVWQLVRLAGNEPDHRTAFPICSSRADWDRRSPRLLRGVPADHRARIEELQPYHHPLGPDAHILRVTQWLSNVDKHQILHPVASAVVDGDPDTTGFRLVKGRGVLGSAEINSGVAVSGGEALLRVALDPPDPDAEVEFYGQVDVELVFGERRVKHEFMQGLFPFGVFVLSRFDHAFGEDLAPEVDRSADASERSENQPQT